MSFDGVTKLLTLSSITFLYEAREDRILAAINAGQSSAWSCWLTRRIVLALLGRASEFLTSTSPVAQRASPTVRKEVVAFEREAAIAKTAPAMSHTPPNVLKTSAPAAELVSRLTISKQGERFRMDLQGHGGGGAGGTLARAELQRVLQMLQVEVTKAAWLPAPAQMPAALPPGVEAPKPAQH